MKTETKVADLERSLAAREQELAVMRQRNNAARVADLERTLTERDNEIAWMRNLFVNPPTKGRIAMINALAGHEGCPDSVYVLTAEGQVWGGTWRLPDYKFSWERVPDLPEEAR